MSTLKHSIEVHPDEKIPCIKHEQHNGGIFICPVCNGRKGFRYEKGRNLYEEKSCTHCKGSGKVKAVVTIDWLACDDCGKPV
jgi:DnaJ-class molecular chaperone